MIILSTGDWHITSENVKADKADKSLDQIVMYCENNPVDYLQICGDLWDVPQREPYYATTREGRGVEIARYYLTYLSKLVKYIVITKGNNEHDSPLSVAKLNKLWAPNILAF